MPKLIALTPIDFNGKPFAEGEPLEVNDLKQARALLEVGAAEDAGVYNARKRAEADRAKAEASSKAAADAAAEEEAALLKAANEKAAADLAAAEKAATDGTKN